jgi:positive regulator of sigma E activity
MCFFAYQLMSRSILAFGVPLLGLAIWPLQFQHIFRASATNVLCAIAGTNDSATEVP